MVEAGGEFVATGVFRGKPGADARAQGHEVLAAQLLDEASVAREHDAQQRLGIEAGAGQEAQLREHGRSHLLRFVDQQHWASSCGFEVSDPAFAQDLEATPAVVWA